MNIHKVYKLTSHFFRTKRMNDFVHMFNLDANTRVLDVGGSDFNWSLISVHPQLTVLNLYPIRSTLNATYVQGDGRFMPFGDKAFDVVFCSSVIEHLSDWKDISALASEIRRVGKCYYVQTPNRFFPMEPHYFTPFVHYLPKSWQKKVVGNFTGWGLLTRPTQEQVDTVVDEIRLLSLSEMQKLFPDAEILHERVLGFSKSLIAVKF